MEAKKKKILKVNWAALLIFYFSVPLLFFILYISFSELSLSEILSYDNLYRSSRFRPDYYISIPIMALGGLIFLYPMVIILINRLSIAWTDGVNVNFGLFKSIPLNEIIADSIVLVKENYSYSIVFRTIDRQYEIASLFSKDVNDGFEWMVLNTKNM